MKIQKNEKGYIALTSVIIISAMIMIIAATMSSYSFFSRSNILDAELKKISNALAEACVETALLKLAQNNSYAGNENISIGGKQCLILAIEAGGQANQKIIKTTASSSNYYANLKITATIIASGILINSWEEVASF